MKNFIFGMLFLGIMGGFFACQKDDNVATDADLINQIAAATNKQAVSNDELPTTVTEYVDLAFTPVQIEAAWRVRGMGYEVELEDGQDLYFRENGRCLGRGEEFRGRPGMRCLHGQEADVADLPTGITDYLGANYPNETIEKAVAKPNGGFAIKLSNDTILLFNADGEFVHECGDRPGGGHGGHGGHGPNGGCAVGDAIDVASLPAAIPVYVADNYGGETITVAVVKPSGKFGVELSNGTVLLFAADGTFIRECDGTPSGPHRPHGQAIDASTLPQAAQDYIAANYPDATIMKAVVFNNGFYGVRLSDGNHILFDADGNVIFDSGN